MGKYTFSLFKTFLVTSFLGKSQKILGEDEIRSIDPIDIENKSTIKAQNSKKKDVYDWIELFRKEIRSVNPN